MHKLQWYIYIYIYRERERDCTKTPNKRIPLYKSNHKLLEDRKIHVSKHLYDCCQGDFNIMPIYQINNFYLLQIKEKKGYLKQTLNRPNHTHTYIHIHTHTYVHKKIYIHRLTQNASKDWGKYILKHNIHKWAYTRTYTHTHGDREFIIIYKKQNH